MSATSKLVTVRLLEVPVRLRHASTQHSEGLLREMTLIMVRQGEESHVPARLVRLADEIVQEYGPMLETHDEVLDRALSEGTESLPELVYDVPESVVELIGTIRHLLAEADAFCRHGDLLTLATPPDIALYREWTLSEFERQVSGKPPTPWPAYRDQHA